MSGNGPSGFPGMRAPVRRPLTEDPYTAPPTGQSQQPQWPPRHGEQPAYAQQQHAYNSGPQAYGAQDAHGAQSAPGYFFPQASAEPPGYAPPPAGHQLPFGSPGPAPAPSYAGQHAQAPRHPGPQAYDLGHYMPAATSGYAPTEAEPFQQHEHDPAHFGAPPQGYGETDTDFDEMLAEEVEPRRGRRGIMIAAALVGAIGLGGAMAYTYKTLVAPSGGRAPVIKAADFGPNKVKPEVSDGKIVPHTDKKLLNRLGEDGAAPPARVVVPTTSAPAADASDDPSGPRKVKIIPFTPGAPPPPQESAPPRPAGPPMVSVPGVMLAPGMPQPPPQGPPPSAARVPLPPPPAQPPVKAAPQPPVKAASVPRTAPAPPQAAEPAPPVNPPVAKTPVPKKPAAAAAPVASTSGTSGYVAVLSSKKSRMDALKAFADIQQKYGDVLASKTPDVQEADLGDKGLWYRAVVGPPGSRDAASAVCNQLKTAGHTACWVTTY